MGDHARSPGAVVFAFCRLHNHYFLFFSSFSFVFSSFLFTLSFMRGCGRGFEGSDPSFLSSDGAVCIFPPPLPNSEESALFSTLYECIFQASACYWTSTKQNKKQASQKEVLLQIDLMNQDDVQTHGFRNFQNFRFMNSMKSIVSLAGLHSQQESNKN